MTINGQDTTLPTAFVTTENVPLNLELQSLETSQSGQGTWSLIGSHPNHALHQLSNTQRRSSLEDGTGGTRQSAVEEPWCGGSGFSSLSQQYKPRNHGFHQPNQIRIEFHDESLAFEKQTFDSSLTESRLAVAPLPGSPAAGYLGAPTQSRLCTFGSTI